MKGPKNRMGDKIRCARSHMTWSHDRSHDGTFWKDCGKLLKHTHR